jgi:hypothetical protein
MMLHPGLLWSNWEYQLLALLVLALAPAAAQGRCPPTPGGYTAFPSHCIGFEPSHNCASSQPYQIAHGECAPGDDLAQCTKTVSRQCDSNTQCHSFAIMAGGINCTHSGDPRHYQLFRLGESNVVSNSDWLSFGKPGNGSLPPAPPSPPHHHGGGGSSGGGAIPQHSDCAIRQLAQQFALGILEPWMMTEAAPAVFDGLELGTRCNASRPNAGPPSSLGPPAAAGEGGGAADAAIIYVDYAKGSDTNPGTVRARHLINVPPFSYDGPRADTHPCCSLL